jgi:hypothetical protein
VCVYVLHAQDGFQDVYVADMAVALEWGLLQWAHDVHDNFYSLYVRRNATVLYRGPEMAQYGRQLTLSAQLYRYSGGAEADQLLKHSDKIIDIQQMLMSRRRQAQQLPKSDPSYGMIRGDDESDEIFGWRVSTSELPHFSFSLEFVRGALELGPVWQEIGAAAGRPDIVAAGTELLAEVAPLSADIHAAMSASTVHGQAITCHPYHLRVISMATGIMI